MTIDRFSLENNLGSTVYCKGSKQGCADPVQDPYFFGQKDPDPSQLTDPYGSGSVPRIRRIFIKIMKIFRFCSLNYEKFVNFLVVLRQLSFVTK